MAVGEPLLDLDAQIVLALGEHPVLEDEVVFELVGLDAVLVRMGV